MQCALNFAERSTCARIKAGAIIAVENHIISTGYNGNAPGKEHCYDYWERIYSNDSLLQRSYSTYEEYLRSDLFKQSHRSWAQKYEFHGEQNSIFYAAQRGIPINGADIYTVYSCCIFCAKAIIYSRISRVFYHIEYDRPEGKEALEVLEENGIIVQKV